MRRLALLLLLAAAPALGQGVNSASAPKPRILGGGPVTPITGGNALYLQVGGSDISGDVNDVATPLPAGRARRLRCSVSVAPGSGKSVTLTLQTGVCGTALADSALTCTTSNTSTTSNDSTNTVSVPAGTCVAVKATYSSGAATSMPRFSLEFG
ncbi:MAG: hypothetical protein SF182_01680 [Deltaproteobacteria bacterium]|nr:hypothetical protein [Deltaproteobacteria bacterium]